ADGVIASGTVLPPSGFPCCALCFGKVENPSVVAVLIVVGQDKHAVAGAQVFEHVATVAAVAPRQPRAGAAGELAIAEVECGVDQSEKWFVAPRKAAAGGSGFEVRVANFAGHDVASVILDPGPKHGGNGSPGPIRVQYTRLDGRGQ